MFFDSTSFFLQRTAFPVSTHDEDHNHTLFDENENIGNNYFENFVTSKSIGNEPDKTLELTDPGEMPEIFNQQELEDFEIRFDHSQPLQQEILLVGGIHYNPEPENTLNTPTPSIPQWVIISSDPRISHLLPLYIEQHQGIILCRNQAIISERNLFIDIEKKQFLPHRR